MKPPLRSVVRAVRDLNRHFDGPGPVYLYLVGRFVWGVTHDDGHPQDGEDARSASEEIPGDDRPLDAVAVARRLIASLGEGE